MNPASRLFLFTVWLLAAATLPAARPNILFLVADDLGFADLGVAGATDLATPQLDALARGGVRFAGAYVSAPVCSPSRAGLITGRYQTRFGHELNHPLADRGPVGLPVTERTAADRFRAAGYVTGHVGKWHLGNHNLPQFTAGERGFAESVWFPGQKKLPPLAPFRNGKQEKAADRFVDEAIAREAAAFVGRHRAAPWFLYVAFLAPHEPMDLPPGAEEPFAAIADPRRRKFAATMALLDGSVGRVLAAVRESGQEERTLIVFLSDNGAPPKNGSRNTPFRGHKGSVWEGGLRVPAVLQWKGTVPAGQVVQAPVIALDFLPTALAAAGVPVPPEARFDGVNLLPLLRGATTEAPHDNLFWRYGDQSAVRAGRWKLVRATDGAATVSGLFDLTADPGEQTDLAAREPAKVRELQARWDKWNAANVRPLWGEPAAR
jgi:arylsulfatase A-like enzyme